MSLDVPEPQRVTPPTITPGQQIISACSGAVLTSLLTTPFDVVKVRLQMQQNAQLVTKPCYLLECRCLDGVTICTLTSDGSHVAVNRFRGTTDAFWKIAQLEGIRSWWKGLSPTLIMAVPMTVIYYAGYDQLKQCFGFRDGHRNLISPAIAGGMARTAAVTAVCPMELVRTKLQSRQGYSYKKVLLVIRNAIKQNGVLSLWRGLSPMLFRDIPFSILYWMGYEYIKLQFHHSHLNLNLTYAIPFLSGSIAGAVSALITNPLDVVKTHVQVLNITMCS